MSLEKRIVEWSASRPPWQRMVLRKVATGHVLSDEDYDQLVDVLVASKDVENAEFGLEHLPQVKLGDPQVGLISIAHPEHVNALESDKPLTFEATSLTIVYGDNGSGKSGYARLLKRIARSRHQEEILSDVFRDTVTAMPRAFLSVRVGEEDVPLTWPESSLPELQRMLFYDEACGDEYIATESDFPYRPSSLFVLDGLINACVAIKSRIEVKLEENARSAKTLPLVDEDLKETEVGKYLLQLSRASSIQALDALIEKLDVLPETIDELKDQEARLRIADTTKERQKFTRQAVKLDSVRTYLESLQGELGDDAVSILQEERKQLDALEQAANLLVKSFESEPLFGVGTSPWKELWESARKFSKAYAYPEEAFPVIGKNSIWPALPADP